MSLLDTLRETFPNAEPVVWCYDGASLQWADHRIVVDVSEDGTGYDLGIYDDEHEAPALFLALPHDVEVVLEYLDSITDLQPEETSWIAWTIQWTSDAVTDGRVPGVVIV